MAPTLLLLVLSLPVRAAEEPLATLDDTVITLPTGDPIARIVFDDVPRVKLDRGRRRARYRGTATAYWRDGKRSRLAVRWTIRIGKSGTRREKGRLRPHPDGIAAAGGRRKLLPRVRLDLRLRDGDLVRLRGKLREEDGAGGVTKTRLSDVSGVALLHAMPAAVLENDVCRLELGPTGRLEGLRVLPDGAELAAEDAAPVIELTRRGETVVPASLRLVGDEIVARFDEPEDRVRIGVTAEPGYLAFRVREVQPADAETLRLRFLVRILAAADGPLNGTFDDESAVCLRSLTANTRCDFSKADGAWALAVEWIRRHGIAGGAAALVAGPRHSFFDSLEALEAAEGLPSPHFGGVRARESEAVRESYLFLTYYRPGDVEKVIEYAKIGGFRVVLFLRDLWRTSEGTYPVHTGNFPGGLDGFVEVCDRIHEAGLGVGVHLFGPSISTDDPLVTPVPREGLLAWDGPPLASAVGDDSKELTLTAAPDLPAPAGAGFPDRYLRVGDEIVHYSEASAGPPFSFLGCERGALGTVAAAHPAGTLVRHLATVNGLFLLDPDSPLVEEVAANLGRVIDAAGIDMVYFDATAVIPTNEFVDRWYYMNRILPAFDAAFDHSVLVQTGMGPGRDLAWHLVPRSASADGHGDIKWYLDERSPAIESFLRGFTAPDVGWYGFDEGRPPDHLEYVAAKCLGWDCSLSVQSHRLALERDPRARETMEMLGRYERAKREMVLSDEVREHLGTAGADFRLLEEDGGGWHLFRAEYEPDRDVRTLDEGAYASSVGNPGAEPCRVGVEIVRGVAIRVDADLSAAGASYLETFLDVTPFDPGGENDFARLVNLTGPVLNVQGPARAGVTHDLSIVEDPRVGGTCAGLTASNGSAVIGWCAVGRRFATPVDLTGTEALGVWIHGDGSGVTVSIELFDDADRRAVFRTPVHYDGWRLHTFEFAVSAAFDTAAVRYLVIVVSDLPPGRDVALRFASLRATPAVRAPVDLSGVRLEIGDRRVVLPAPLPPGGTARIDALGRLTLWPGGMTEGSRSTLPDGAIVLDPGTYPIRFEVDDPDGYPGDVSIRFSRLLPE